MKTEAALLHVIDAISSIGRAVGGMAIQAGVSGEVLIELQNTVRALDGALSELGAPTMSSQAPPRSKAH